LKVLILEPNLGQLRRYPLFEFIAIGLALEIGFDEIFHEIVLTF